MFLLVSGRHVGVIPDGLHTNLYKFGLNIFTHVLLKKNCCDLNLGESLCIFTFFLFPDSGLYLLISILMYFEWRDTSNSSFDQKNIDLVGVNNKIYHVGVVLST